MTGDRDNRLQPQAAGPRRRCRDGPARGRGFTLVEVAISMAILSVICVALGSVLVLGGRAMTMGTAGPGAQTDAALSATRQIVSDLQLALSFSERTPTAVTFTVPDRTGDNQPDTIRYAWAGTAGGPLTVQLNGGPAVAIADQVQSVNFGYLTRTVGTDPAPTGGGGSGPAAPVESAEQLLVSRNPSSSVINYAMTEKAWCGAYFKPTLPANATAWRITRVRFYARKYSGASAVWDAQVRAATGLFAPSSTNIIQTVPVSTAGLPTNYGWVEAAFSGASNLNPANGYCFTLTQAMRATSGVVEASGEDLVAGLHWATGTASNSWTPDYFKEMVIQVYGTYTTPAP